MDPVSLDGIDAFVRVAERRSFSAAARELGISPSALSQRIRALEERAGVALLSRTTRRVGLTQAGAILLARAKPAFADVALAWDEARNLRAPAGLLRLHMPPSIIALVIQPILQGFLAAYPKIEIEVVAENRRAEIVADGFDAAVSLGETLDPDMVALRLTAPIRFCVVGSSAYFARHGIPRHPDELRGHNCARLRLAEDRTGMWSFRDGGRLTQIPVTGNLVSNDYGLTIVAAIQGVALAYVAERTVHDEVGRGELQTVLADYMPTSDGVFLYYPRRAQVLPKLRAFVDYVQSARDGPA